MGKGRNAKAKILLPAASDVDAKEEKFGVWSRPLFFLCQLKFQSRNNKTLQNVSDWQLFTFGCSSFPSTGIPRTKETDIWLGLGFTTVLPISSCIGTWKPNHVLGENSWDSFLTGRKVSM